jgi:phage N-6-adenine-methyltransferase
MNSVLFSSKKEEWETPIDLFVQLNNEFHFDIDVCALPENAKCKKYYTPETNGLTAEWKGNCWCNPPYGKKISLWVEKAYNESKKGATVVMLLPSRTDTKWFHTYIYKKAEIRFIKGRLKFGNAQNAAPFPSMIVIFKKGENNNGELQS